MAWRRYMIFGHQNFRGFEDEQAISARTELERRLKELYEEQFPGKGISYHEFKKEAIRQIKTRLRSG